jgi:hypothetical protein
MFLNGYDAFWYSSWSNYMEFPCSSIIMSHNEIHYGSCHIFYISKWLCHITTFILADLCWIVVFFKRYVTPLLCSIVTFTLVTLCQIVVLLNGNYVTKSYSWRVRVDCGISQWLFHIAMFSMVDLYKPCFPLVGHGWLWLTFITLWCSSRVMLNCDVDFYSSYCDIGLCSPHCDVGFCSPNCSIGLCFSHCGV